MPPTPLTYQVPRRFFHDFDCVRQRPRHPIYEWPSYKTLSLAGIRLFVRLAGWAPDSYMAHTEDSRPTDGPRFLAFWLRRGLLMPHAGSPNVM